jgi:hypothetical protein
MSRRWRRAAAAALVSAAVITAQFIAVSQAQAAAPTITIAATAKGVHVRGYTVVEYLGGTYGAASIHGTITGAAAGDVAALYAQQFPFRNRPVRVGAVTLKAGKATYSFTVGPSLATRYAVRLFVGRTARELASSPLASVYVAPYAYVTGGQTCARPVCDETFHEHVIVPSSALSGEMSDHLYPYFGLNLSPTGAPPQPKWLYLWGGNASVGAARKLAADEFERTITFSFTVGNEGYWWAWDTCVRDNEASNGIGLPGYHGCGDSQIPNAAGYRD